MKPNLDFIEVYKKAHPMMTNKIVKRLITVNGQYLRKNLVKEMMQDAIYCMLYFSLIENP